MTSHFVEGQPRNNAQELVRSESDGQVEAKNLQRAIKATTAQGVTTRDLGGTATTDAVVAAVIDNLNV